VSEQGVTGAKENTQADVQPVTIELRVRLRAIAIPEVDGGFSVIVPALPGCFTDADTIEEAVRNVREAAELWLSASHERDKAEALRIALGES
jgi:predicted RNase H-like HicB family nuclease